MSWYLLLKKPEPLTDQQWTTAVTVLKTSLNIDANSGQPNNRLHASKTDNGQIIFEANFGTLTDAQIASAISTAISGAVSAEDLEPRIKGNCRKLCDHAQYTTAADYLRLQWTAPTQSFVWMSDTHLGADYSSTGFAERINTIAPDLVIHTGDVSDNSAESEFTEYTGLGITADVYTVPGNHDEGAGLDHDNNTEGQVATYDTYDAAGLTRHFSVTLGSLQLIGFTSTIVRPPSADRNKATVSQTELDYITAELAALDGKTPILCTHFNPGSFIADDTAALLSLINTYSVKAVLCGHSHLNCTTGVLGSAKVVNGGCLMHTWAGEVCNDDGGWMTCNVFSNRIEIDYARARSPWDLFGATDNPTANEPYYDPVVIWL